MRVLTGLLALTTLALGQPAQADGRTSAALGPDLPVPGAAYDEARAMKLPPDHRLICDTDSDKPKFEHPKYMDPPSGRGPARVRRCAVFAPGADGVWKLGEVPSLAGPARLWMVFVEQGIGGRFRLAQLSLWAKRDGWAKVSDSLVKLHGAGAGDPDRFLSWQDDQLECTMFVDEKNPDEFAVSVADQRLKRLLRSPGATSKSEQP